MASDSPLITAERLEARLGHPRLQVFDCRFSLSDPARGAAKYREGHIPGAHYADLDKDLADLSVAHRGRHPLPERERFIAWLESRGVSNDTTLVAYDDAGGAIAARLWWMARWAGIADARLLDGGLGAWTAAGFPLETIEPGRSTGTVTRTPPEQPVATIDDALSIAGGDPARVLLDARDPARFRGEKEPIDPVAGHVPTALSAPFAGNLDESGRFLPPSELRERFEALAGDRDPSAIVHMCGSGVTACHNLLAMELAGLGGSSLFPGSWSEWVDDRSRPVATGKDD